MDQYERTPCCSTLECVDHTSGKFRPVQGMSMSATYHLHKAWKGALTCLSVLCGRSPWRVDDQSITSSNVQIVAFEELWDRPHFEKRADEDQISFNLPNQ